MIFEDQYLQITAKLPTKYIYGLGEAVHDRIRLKTGYTRQGIFSRDHFVEEGYNLYGSHPFILGYDSNDEAFGIYFKTGNGVEVDIAPGPTVTWRIIGGIFDIYFFTGPTAQDVISQYTEIFGRPMIPPFWSLGFQLSRWGWNTLENMEAAYDRTVNNNIPIDVMYGDIDYRFVLLK